MIAYLVMLTGMGFYKDKYMSKDGVKIVIYKQGKKMPVAPNRPHFKELQEKCEGFVSSVNNALRAYVLEEDVFTIKKNELAVEVVYNKPKEIKIPFFNSRTERDHLLIPLTGKYVSTEKKLRATIFFYGPGYSVKYIGPYSAPRDVTEIIDLLKLMGINID